MESLKRKLGSRKFLFTLAYAIVIIANAGLEWGMSEGDMVNLAAVVIGYNAAEGYVDSKKVK
jgi:hypothetical protein